MKEQIDAILQTLQEAQRRIAQAKACSDDPPADIETLIAIDEGLSEIRAKLERMKDNQP